MPKKTSEKSKSAPSTKRTKAKAAEERKALLAAKKKRLAAEAKKVEAEKAKAAEAEAPKKWEEAKAEVREAPVVVKEELDAPVEKAELPKAVPVQADTERRVEAISLVTGQANIGGFRYTMNKGELVRGGVLQAHLLMLEKAGKVKRKA